MKLRKGSDKVAIVGTYDGGPNDPRFNLAAVERREPSPDCPHCRNKKTLVKRLNRESHKWICVQCGRRFN